MINTIQEAKLPEKAEIEKIPFEDFFRVFNASPLFFQIIEEARKLAKGKGLFLYFAGGVVRDYYLKAITQDLDMVLQGDLFSFLDELFKKVPGRLLFKSQFLTAKVEFGAQGEKVLVDFITARKEKYPEVAALPIVYPSNFLDDIKRRDFTINSMIYGLTPPFEEVVIDLYKGKEDLRKRLVKPLKEDSFVEDPTRAFRGVRYRVRFGFEYDKKFIKALEEAFAKKAFLKLSGSRLGAELYNFLKKEPLENLPVLLKDVLDLGIFEACNLEVKKELIEGIARFFGEFSHEFKERERKKAYLLCFAGDDLRDAPRLGFSKEEVERLGSSIKGVILKFNKIKEPYERVSFLERVTIEVLPFLAVKKGFWKEVELFLKRYSKIKPSLTGKELKALGIPEGKAIGECLKLIKKEIFAGRIKSKEDEVQFVKKLLKNGAFSIKI